jgi:hypothetical protein
MKIPKSKMQFSLAIMTRRKIGKKSRVIVIGVLEIKKLKRVLSLKYTMLSLSHNQAFPLLSKMTALRLISFISVGIK